VQGDAPIGVKRPGGPDAFEKALDPASRSKFEKAERAAAAERQKHEEAHAKRLGASNVEEELTSADRDRAAGTADVDLQEQLRARANAEHDALVAQHTAAPKGSRIVNESGEDMLALLRGSKFMGPGGELMPVEASVSHGQAHDFVDDARGRRFWVYKSAEEKAAASATSHDCVRGSLLLVRCGPHYLALARVVRLGTLSGGGGDGSKSMCKSLKLEPGSKQQWFKLELCVVEEKEVAAADEADDGANAIVALHVRSSGLQLPVSNGERVIQLVQRSTLHAIEGAAYAIMNRSDELALRRRANGQLGAWLQQDHITGLQPLEAEVPLPDASLCFNCHIGWADETTGPLLACKGSCKRSFHAGCRPNFDGDQLCGLCAGTDEVVCGICRRDWSDPSKASDYYTGELVLCDGGCSRAFHQICHSPPISDSLVAGDDPFICTDCEAARAGNCSPPAACAVASAGAPPTVASRASPLPIAMVPATASVVAPNATASTAAPITTASAAAPMATASAAAPTLASVAPPTAIPAIAVPTATLPSIIPNLQLTLTRGIEGRLGMGLDDGNAVEKVTQSGAADRGGVKVGDQIVEVNGTRLAPGAKLVDVLPKGGYRAKVYLGVYRATAATLDASLADLAPSGRKRSRPPELADMATLHGVRTGGNGGQSHIQRLAHESEANTEHSL
jgi:hypothetical protein